MTILVDTELLDQKNSKKLHPSVRKQINDKFIELDECEKQEEQNNWGQTYTIDICCNLKDSLIDRSDREMLLPGKKNRGRWKRSVPVIRKGIICELSQSPKRMQVL